MCLGTERKQDNQTLLLDLTRATATIVALTGGDIDIAASRLVCSLLLALGQHLGHKKSICFCNALRSLG